MRKTIYLLQVLIVCLLSCNNSSDNDKKVSTDTSQTAGTPVGTPTTSSADTATQITGQKGADIHARLALTSLRVDEKTDKTSEEDEVYVLLAGKKSDSSEITIKLPAGLRNWSLTKSGGAAQQAMETKYGPYPAGFSLWSGNLKDGESIVLNILFMDEDQSKPPARNALLSQLAKQTDVNDPKLILSSGIASVVEKVLAGNTDDFVGAYAVKISNENGNKKIEWEPLEGAIDKGTDEHFGKRYDVKGAGASYSTSAAVY